MAEPAAQVLIASPPENYLKRVAGFDYAPPPERRIPFRRLGRQPSPLPMPIGKSALQPVRRLVTSAELRLVSRCRRNSILIQFY